MKRLAANRRHSNSGFHWLTKHRCGLVLSAAAVGGLLATRLAPAATTLWWDAGSGSANWDTSTTVWSTTAGGSATNAWASGDAGNFSDTNFTTTPFVANLDASTTVAGITFYTGNATIVGNSTGVNGLTLSTGITIGNTTGGTTAGSTVLDSSLGTITLSTAATSFINNGTGSFTIGANLQNASSVNETLTIKGAQPTIINGKLQNNSGGDTLAVTIGNGTLTLNGTNTYSGTTTVDDAAALIVNNAGAVGSGTLVLGSGTTGVTFTNSAVGSLNFSNPVQMFENVTFGSGGNLVFSNTGSYTLGNSSHHTWTINNSSTELDTAFNNATGNTITLAGTGTLVLGGTSTWTGGGGITVDSPATLQIGNGTSGSVSGAVITVNNGASLTEGSSGTITGNASLILETPTTTLNGSNSYTGNTTLYTGDTLIVNNANAIGTGTLILNTGTIAVTFTNSTSGPLTFTNPIQLVENTIFSGGNLTFSNTGTDTINNTSANHTWTVNNASTELDASFIVNAETITGAGTGTLILGGNNSWTTSGGIYVSAGTTQIGNATGGAVSNAAITVNGSAFLTEGAGGNITGNSTVGISNGGTANLSTANTYTGNTTVGTGGSLIVGNANALGSGTLILGNTTGGATFTNSAGTLTISNPVQPFQNVTIGSGGNLVFSNTGSYSLTSSSNHVWTINNASTEFDTTFANPTGTSLTVAGTGTLVLGGNNTWTAGGGITAGNGSNTPTLQIGNAVTGAVSGIAITVNSGALLKEGAGGNITGNSSITINAGGTGNLTAANGYSGNTTLTGNLNVNNNSALGNGSGTLIFNNGGTLINATSGSLTFANPLSIVPNTAPGMTIGSGGNIVFSSAPAIPTGSQRYFTINNGNTTFSGSFAGGGSLYKAGPGTLILAAANTHAGDNVSAGIMAVSGAGTLGNTATATVTMSGGTLDLGNTSQTVNTVNINTAASSGNTIQNGSLTANSYSVTTTAGNAMVTANLLGAGGLATSGGGNLTLVGANTYSGSTTVGAGTLNLGTGGSLGNTSVAVSAGATFLANAGTAVAVGYSTTTFTLGTGNTSAATLSLADGTIGNFTIGGALSMATGNVTPILVFDIGNGTTDLLKVNSLSFAGGNNTIALNFLSGLTGLSYGNFTLISASTANNVPGDWMLGAGNITIGNVTYKLNLNGSTTAAEILTVAPNTPTGPVVVTWNGNNSGSWDTSTNNWQGSALYADSDSVVFDDTAAGPNFTVDLGGATVNPGNVTVNNSSNAYSIGNGTIGGNATLVKNGTNSLTLTGANTFAGGTIVNAGTLDVAAATNGLLSGSTVANYAALQFDGTQSLATITGNGTTTISGNALLAVTNFTQANLVNNGAVTLNGNGTISTAVSGAGNLTVSSTGVLTAASFTQTALVNNGMVAINGNGTIAQLTGSGNLTIGTGASNNTVQLTHNLTPDSFTHTQQALTISTGSTLDITNNMLLLNYGSGSTPLAAVRAAVANGALMSSTVAAGNPNEFAIGYADATELGSIPSGNVEVMFTLGGDALLTGTVNFDDYSVLQNNYNQSGRDWAQGDFNNDGMVNFNDYSILQNNYEQSLFGAIAEPLMLNNGVSAAVPEPASLGLLLLGGLPVLMRRRRKV